jgi:hypothetical protein
MLRLTPLIATVSGIRAATNWVADDAVYGSDPECNEVRALLKVELTLILYDRAVSSASTI